MLEYIDKFIKYIISNYIKEQTVHADTFRLNWHCIKSLQPKHS